MLNPAKVIVGLGNPGKEYENTRHNLGFRVISELSRQRQARLSSSSFTKALTGRADIEGHACILVLPLNYMNQSGPVVRRILDQNKTPPENLLVVCDDISLEFGRMRLRARGSSAGHNGLNSLIEHLGSEDFARLRLGIGRPPSSPEAVDYVLGEFSGGERKALPEFIARAVQCCGVWLLGGISKAMDEFNKK